MALGVIIIEGGLARGIVVACLLVSAVISVFFAKWCFANAVSSRAATIEIADLAEVLGPDDPQTHYAAAVFYERTFSPEDLDHSLDEYELAAARSPNNYLAWLELGKARGRDGDVQGSERAFLRTLELAPNYSDVQWAYGNFLLRSGRTDEGFAYMGKALIGKSEYVNAAAVTAMEYFEGDADAVRRVLGDTGLVNSALVKLAIRRKRFDEAAAAWDKISAEEKQANFTDVGKDLAGQLVAAKQFRMAVRVVDDIMAADAPKPAVGKLFNGNFESPVKLKDASTFDWQIAGGTEPQIGINDAQKRGGAYSLYMVFNTMQTSDMRSVSQMVAVEPGRAYTFEGYFRAELKGAIAWEIVDASDGKSLTRTSAIQTAADWTGFQTSFAVPPGSDGITIRLVRDGCNSSVCPISGKVWFDDLTISM